MNIVETNLKPPPTQNFRRRRRLSGSTAANSDPEYPAQQLLSEEDVDALPHSSQNAKVTTTIGSIYSASNGVLNTKDEDMDECLSEDGLRGILKNKPIKPKSYHLGENMDSGSSLWGVKLKPVDNNLWRHSTELESAVTKKFHDDNLEKEFKNSVQTTEKNHNGFLSTVSSDWYSTKINLSSLPQNNSTMTDKGKRFIRKYDRIFIIKFSNLF